MSNENNVERTLSDIKTVEEYMLALGKQYQVQITSVNEMFYFELRICWTVRLFDLNAALSLDEMNGNHCLYETSDSDLLKALQEAFEWD